MPRVGSALALDSANTLFAHFEDVALSFRILWDNAEQGRRAALCNDGYRYQSHREEFELDHNEALRLTLQHPGSGEAAIAMWWKVEENVKTDADFKKFRDKVLNSKVVARVENGIAEITVATQQGNLGVKADIVNKKRLAYFNPSPLPSDFLFNVDGIEIGRPLLDKYLLDTKK